MDVNQLLLDWEAEEQAVRARLRPADAPPPTTRVQGLSGMQVFEAIFAGDLPAPPMGQTLDFVPIRMEPGLAVFQGRPQRRHYNPLGTVRGGWFATLLDSAVGCAVHSTLPAGRGYTTLEIKVSLVRPLTDTVSLVRALDGAFLTTRACMRAMVQAGKGGTILYMGSVHSHEASPLKAPYLAAKHALIGLAKVVAKEGAKDRIRANVICPGFVRTPLVDKQIPEQAKALGISEAEVIKSVMLKETVDGEFTTTQDVAQTAVFLAAFATNALTGQSITVSHGWHMQ